jgi:hypothetical protein
VFLWRRSRHHRQSGSTENVPTQLPAKILQIHTLANSPGIQETFVYRVLFDAGRQLLQQGDHAVTQASVELVIAGKNVQFFRKLRLFELEPGVPIFIPSRLASALRAITQPSLLLRTTTGFPRKSGLKTLSQLA